jgi:hypothetical protein
MSTKVMARRVVGTFRLVGVTAAVAAGIAGFVPVETEVPTDVAVVAKQTEAKDLPAHVCDKLMENDRVRAHVVIKHGCLVIGEGPGPIEGAPLFS